MEKTKICINNIILNDDKIKAQHLYTFLQLVNIADDEGIVIFTLKDLMQMVKCKDKETVIKYLNVLVENGYMDKLEPTNRKSTYKLNKKYYNR